ncbi:MAG: ABC transporter permease subunit [Trueperaceae bacterium]|nr:ABC transporter permease subunit [Trueperaceae bacterium]
MTFNKVRPRGLLTTIFTIILAALWVYPIFRFFNPVSLFTELFYSFDSITELFRSRAFLESLEFTWYLNSLGIALAVTAITLFICAPCAYAVSRLEFPGKNILFWSLLAGIILPKEVLFVPLFMDLASVGLANHYVGISLPQVIAPLIILAFKYYFDQVPDELREAAYLDGASEWRILWFIFIPVNQIITLVLLIYVFITAWNNFFWPFIITYSEELMTLPVALGTQGFGTFGFTGLAATVIFFLLLGSVMQLLLVRTGIITVGIDKRGFAVQARPLFILLGSIAAVIGIFWGATFLKQQLQLRQPLPTPLQTRWAKEVTAENVHQEYPRPQRVRKDWQNLNGLWDYALRGKRSQEPKNFDGQILVPFPIESALSGVALRADERKLWYHRNFSIPEDWQGQRIMLHFGAVDWETTVWVNDQEIGTHKGGYDSFSFDITAALSSSSEQKLVVSVLDPSDTGTQPRGKQVREPRGIWYTSTSGIWQTVWLEPVPQVSIDKLIMTPDIDANILNLRVNTLGEESTNLRIKAVVTEAGKTVKEAEGSLSETLTIRLFNAKRWSPDDPFLYDLEVTLLAGDTVVDRVSSYFGMRKISIEPDETGVVRLFLNNEPLFQYGLLDQGFWPDGLYTAPTDEALRYDLEVTRQLGFNMVRKHVKVESDRWYYWADKLGLLVWQDMPSGDALIGNGEGELERSEASAQQFELELERMIDGLYNHPSIVMWVLFNEGWGQYDTARLTDWLKNRDPSRLVNSASGWNDFGNSDVRDIHSYPGPNAPQQYGDRASVLGEFGGLGLAITGLTWQDEENWGYQQYADGSVLLTAYDALIRRLRYLSVEEGLAAAVYTQTTDVEVEVNGMMTYDRALIKMDPVQVSWSNRILYRDPPIITRFVSTSEDTAIDWRYSFTRPDEGWTLAGFDDSSWTLGPAGFGTDNSRGGTVRTEWTSPEIWLRHSFNLTSTYVLYPYLKAHHNDAMDVYLNGQLIKTLPNYTFDYVRVPLDPEIRELFKEGKNTLSVHCKKVAFGQYCDAGLFDTSERLESGR